MAHIAGQCLTTYADKLMFSDELDCIVMEVRCTIKDNNSAVHKLILDFGFYKFSLTWIDRSARK